MRKRIGTKTMVCVLGSVMFVAGWLAGQEKAATQKTVIHSAAWTARDNMTQKDLDNFRAETAALVGKVHGLRRVWIGKLREPVTFDGNKRTYGIVLEFDDVQSKNAYSDVHPQPWYEHFQKMRATSGSSNFDTVGNSTVE